MILALCPNPFKSASDNILMHSAYVLCTELHMALNMQFLGLVHENVHMHAREGCVKRGLDWVEMLEVQLITYSAPFTKT